MHGGIAVPSELAGMTHDFLGHGKEGISNHGQVDRM